MILVVEDHADLRAILEMILNAAGYDTSVASDGRSALAFLAKATPSLVILDIGLPDIDGWTVLREIRASPSTQRLPVLVYSAAQTRGQAIAAGADAFLQKGKDNLDSVLAAVQRLAA